MAGSERGARGYLDGVSEDGVASGWAYDPALPQQALTVELCVDDEPSKSTIADLFRSDLAAKEVGNGRHGFSLDLSPLLLEERVYAISARVESVALKNVVRVRGGTVQLKRKQAEAPTRVLHVEGQIASAARAARERRRLALVSCYTKHGRVYEYHRRLLRDLAGQGFATVVVRNGDEHSSTFLEQSRDLADLVIVRENRGFDFSAWLCALSLLDVELEALDHLIFCNDSVVGPLFPLSEAIARMSAADCDFWGMTDSWGRAYHLQSYFLVFKAAALRSTALRQFFHAYGHPTDKNEVITQGEVGLTQALMAADLRAKAYCPYLKVAERWLHDLPRRVAEGARSPEASLKLAPDDPLRQVATARSTHHAMVASSLRTGEPLNSTHHLWDTLIRDFRLPFVKKDLLLRNPEAVPDLGSIHPLLETLTDFPPEALFELFALSPGSLAPPIPFALAPPADTHPAPPTEVGGATSP